VRIRLGAGFILFCGKPVVVRAWLLLLYDALFRRVLAEVAAGIRSAPEAELRELIASSSLPPPLYNPDLYLNGKFLARPDAWWPQAAVAVEVDSKEWHLLPSDWQRTLRRHRRMTAAGIYVVHLTRTSCALSRCR
jgi:hypothetical protein